MWLKHKKKMYTGCTTLCLTEKADIILSPSYLNLLTHFSTTHSGMRLGGSEEDWNTMWNLYLNETDAQERTKLLHGLAHSSEPWILQR